MMKKKYKKTLKKRRNENQEATPTTTTNVDAGNEKDDKMKTYTQNRRLQAQEIGVYRVCSIHFYIEIV